MTSLEATLQAQIASGPPLLLDGALGTEIERRGVPCGLPLWSTHALVEAPDVVRSIHRDYVRAGARVLTACTFRTQARSLAAAGLPEPAARASELCERAVALAREAIHGATDRVLVAGSAPPLEDCYRPDLVPTDADALREHREHARNLARAGVDLIAVETMNTAREARAAAEAAAETGLPFWVSFTCGPDAELLSGEPLARAVDAVREARPLAVGVNCLPPDLVPACLPVLSACGLPFLVYANLGAPDPRGGRTHACSPEAYAEHARGWLRAGARAIGGCCGTGPEHVRALARAFGA
jgi:S-methylmethionine-dependent homocysteine/selenocysteine methylase